METVHQASANINDDIIYQFSYGEVLKYKDGQRVMSASGYSYKDFVEMVLHNYPLHEQKKVLFLTK